MKVRNEWRKIISAVKNQWANDLEDGTTFYIVERTKSNI